MTKDTHGAEGEGWYGFDLDGTLAKYDKWEGIDHIGAPVGPMVERIKKLHEEGRKVKILTARVSPRADVETRPNPYLENHWCIEAPDDMPWALRTGTWTALEFIQDWCYRHLGFVPEITHEKDHLMLDLYDDRCHQVVPNTGKVVEEQYDALYREYGNLRRLASELASSNKSLSWWERVFWASVGASLLLGLATIMAEVFKADHPDRVEADHPACVEAEERLKAALSEYIEAKGPGFLPSRGLGLEVR